MLKGQKRPYYGKRTKQQVIDEYFRSSASMDELSELHGILGSNTVADWLRKYGNLRSTNFQNAEVMNKGHSPIDDKIKRKKRYQSELQLRIGALESDLEMAQKKVRFYSYALSILNDLAKELTGVDLLKKTGQALSRRSTKQGS